MRRVLGSIAVVVLAAALAAPPALGASPKLVVTDPAGDALDGSTSMDVTNVTYEVKALKKGDKPSLVIVMTLAGPPASQLVGYHMRSEIPGCGTFHAAYAPGTVFAMATNESASSILIGCGDASATSDSVLLFVPTRVKDNTITWSIAVDSIPKDARNGKKLTNLRGYTTLAEPVFGIYGNGETDTDGLIEGLPHDEVRSDKEFIFN